MLLKMPQPLPVIISKYSSKGSKSKVKSFACNSAYASSSFKPCKSKIILTLIFY